MTGRAYMGEVLTQVWLKSVKKLASYLTSECTKREFVKILHASSYKPAKKCGKKRVPKIF